MKKYLRILFIIGFALSSLIAFSQRIRPADYDLLKVAKINLSDLEAKKSLDAGVIKKLISASIQETIRRKTISSYYPVNPNEYLVYLDSAVRMYREIEAARTEAKRLVGNKNYLKRLQIEFHCSRKVALEHQRVRISNIDISNCSLVSVEEIKTFNEETIKVGNPIGYSIRGTNEILLPYDLHKQNKNCSLGSVALHEFLHKATNSRNGLSDTAVFLLGTYSFHPYRVPEIILPKDSFEVSAIKSYSDYHSSVEERYVAFKILESQLDSLGVMRLGGAFTKETYVRMMVMFYYGELKDEAEAFIFFTKCSGDKDKDFIVFKQLFDVIA